MQRTILDRLSERASSRRPGGASVEAAEIIESIRLDLEDLLNTHSTLSTDLSEQYPRASESIVAFGLPAAREVWCSREESAEDLRLRVTRAVTTFELRLKDVQVEVMKDPKLSSQPVVLLIRGTIRAHDAEDRVSWNSTLRSGVFNLLRE